MVHPETAHDEHARDPERGLALSFALTAVILVVELAAAMASHSLALMADAGHILTDVVALGLAWFAVRRGRRPADLRRTYGYHRTGMLTALFNGVALVLIGIAIVVEAVQRLGNPQAIAGPLVLVSALLAVAVNSFIALRLRGHGHNLNVRAASLHVLGDLAASMGVVVAALVIMSTGWLYADPLISICIAVLVMWGAARIVLDTVHVLLDSVPRGIDIEAVRAAIVGVSGVRAVHDLHVWALGSSHTALSCHVVMDESSMADGEHAVRSIEQSVCRDFGIAHTTIQVEMCHPCAHDSHAAGQHNHPHAVPIDH
jgi:cobalt-zinc-cadmium efflux system protein